MTKCALLVASMLYAASATAATMNKVQDAPEAGRSSVDLNATPAPGPGLRAAESAVYFVYIQVGAKEGEFGTAFVVANEAEGSRRRLRLVTSDHVLGQFCDDQRCRNELQIHPEGRVVRDSVKKTLVFASEAIDTSTLTVLRRDAVRDLAMIEIMVDASVNPRPLKIARRPLAAEQTAWLIGYPNVYMNLPKWRVDQPNVLTRRWSQGHVLAARVWINPTTGAMEEPENSADADMIPVTTPALMGNSGGPALNERGEVVGVLRSAARTKNSFNLNAGLTELGDLREFLNLGPVAQN